MATKAEMMHKIDELFNIPGIGASLCLNMDTIAKAYEAYIFGLCKKAVEKAGGRTTLRGILTGDNPNPIILRGAPGNMASGNQDFCYIYCELNEEQFEIHLDVQYEGKSGASHEMDVSIYSHHNAQAVRESGRLPKTNTLLMLFECKFYTMSVPSAGLAREFVGLIRDCSTNRMNAFVANNASQNLKKYLTNKSNVEPFVDLDPLNEEAEERFVKNVEQALRKWAV